MTGCVAYFCMEFGLSEEFPIYAGGLGILAGDYIKSARDLRLPVIGVGLRWARGYSRQRIGDGRPARLRVPAYRADVLEDTGVRVRVRIAMREVAARVWRTEHCGNAPLYLLEPVATPDAWITHRLYDAAHRQPRRAGDPARRRRRARAPHARHRHRRLPLQRGPRGVRRRRADRRAHGGRRDVRPRRGRRCAQQIVFTTHTPVAAGNEVHALAELRRLGACCELVDGEMRQIGGDPFNMTVAGLRLSRALERGVRAPRRDLARDVARRRGRGRSSRSPTACTRRPGRTRASATRAAARGRAVGDATRQLKRELLDEVAARTGARLDPGVLTIGFARRAATYKRGDLIFRDPERIEPLLERPPAPARVRRQGAPRRRGGQTHRRRPGGDGAALSRGRRLRPDYDMALGAPSRAAPTCGSTTRSGRSRRGARRA